MKKRAREAELSQEKKGVKPTSIPFHATQASISAQRLQEVIRNLLSPHIKEEKGEKPREGKKEKEWPPLQLSFKIGDQTLGVAVKEGKIHLRLPDGAFLSFPLKK